jgi:flavin-dependent dehydrogenase
MYDVIVIGARCAGSPTAMLLARKGYRVLLLDRAAFPSDTISTHIVWPPGAERLKRWGLLDKVLDSNCPALSKFALDLGPFALTGSPPPVDRVSTFLAPRRTVLDKILVDAAVEAGAELRENCLVSSIVIEDGRVTGVRCSSKGGSEITEKARLVIGADGKHSIVARAVNAQEYNFVPPLTCWYYTYWSGVPADGITFFGGLPNRAAAINPTNDGLVCIPVAWPANEFSHVRADIEGNYLTTVELTPGLADQVSGGRREERIYGMVDLPNYFLKSSGPGWALVGDAGYHKDPVTAQGISDAFFGAETLAEAVDAGLSGKEPLEAALATYEQRRDEQFMPMYEFTCDWAKLASPTPETEALIGALLENQPETDRFLGTIAGTVPLQDFYSPENLQQITGAAGN